MALLRGREARLDIPVSVSEIPVMSDIPTNDVKLAIALPTISENLTIYQDKTERKHDEDQHIG